jgi:hypothetical protein
MVQRGKVVVLRLQPEVKESLSHEGLRPENNGRRTSNLVQPQSTSLLPPIERYHAEIKALSYNEILPPSA